MKLYDFLASLDSDVTVIVKYKKPNSEECLSYESEVWDFDSSFDTNREIDSVKQALEIGLL